MENTSKSKLEIINMLMFSAAAGNNKGLEEALRLGADIHTGDDYALCSAAGGGHTKTVELLLNLGARIHAANDAALEEAAFRGHTKTVEVLLDRVPIFTQITKGRFTVRHVLAERKRPCFC